MRQPGSEPAEGRKALLLTQPILQVAQLGHVLEHHDAPVEAATVQLEHRYRQNDAARRIRQRDRLGVLGVERQRRVPARGHLDELLERHCDEGCRIVSEQLGGLGVAGQYAACRVADQDPGCRRFDDPLRVGVQNPVLLGLAAEVIEQAGALQGQRGLGREAGHHLPCLATEGEDTPAQAEVGQTVNRSTALERQTQGVTGVGQGALGSGGIGRVDDLPRQHLGRITAAVGNAEEAVVRAPDVGRDELELEPVMEHVGQPSEDLARVARAQELARRLGEQTLRCRSAVVEPLVEETLHPLAHRLDQDHQQHAGGECDEVPQRAEVRRVAEQNPVRGREDESAGNDHQRRRQEVAGDRLQIPQPVLDQSRQEPEGHCRHREHGDPSERLEPYPEPSRQHDYRSVWRKPDKHAQCDPLDLAPDPRDPDRRSPPADLQSRPDRERDAKSPAQAGGHSGPPNLASGHQGGCRRNRHGQDRAQVVELERRSPFGKHGKETQQDERHAGSGRPVQHAEGRLGIRGPVRDARDDQRGDGERKEGRRLPTPGPEHRPQRTAQPEDCDQRPREVDHINPGRRRVVRGLALVAEASPHCQCVAASREHEQRIVEAPHRDRVDRDDEIALLDACKLGRAPDRGEVNLDSPLHPGHAEVEHEEAAGGAHQGSNRDPQRERCDDDQDQTAKAQPDCGVEAG